MSMLRSRRHLAILPSDERLFEPLEPRVVLDGTPTDPANPVVEMQTAYGNIYIELFAEDAPATVDNFLGYVQRGDYDGTFLHRHVEDFVIQGGGYSWDEDRQSLENVVQRDPVVNEFGRSNVQWTVAMAKLGGDPNSATSEWFFNLSDNSDNLDNQNGGFTVFGEVIGGRSVIATIAGLRVANLGGAFSTLPVTDSYDSQRNEIFSSDLVVLEDVELVYDPDSSLVVDPTVSPSGSANGANRTTVVLPNGLDRAIAFEQNGAGAAWTVVDLGLKSDTGHPGNTPVTWIDPKDGRTYAAAVSTDGVMLYQRTGPGEWNSRNLNAEIGADEIVTSTLTVFVGRGGAAYLAGVTGDGDLILFTQSSAKNGAHYTWTARNLSETDLAEGGFATPTFTSGLASYVTSWNGLNIVGLDENGDVQGVWWAPGQARWQVANLSSITRAPEMQGTIAPYLTSWGAINLAGTDADGNVVVTWWVPNGRWTTSNLTSLFGGPTLDPGSVASYVTPWGGTNVLGRDIQGRVVVYWWAPGIENNRWKVTVLSDFIEGAEIPTGTLVGFSSPSGTVNLFGAAEDGELIRYWWKPNDSWQWQNVSALAEFI